MTRAIARLLAASGLAAVALTAALATATAANAATGIQLRETVPTTSISGNTVTVTAVKTNPTAPAKNYTFAAYISGQPVTFDATNGGSLTVPCGQSWTITETRTRSVDFFVVGGSQSAAVSYADVAPSCNSVELKEIAPTSTVSGNTATVTVVKVNPTAPARNFSFYAYVNGQQVALDPTSGGSFTVPCGQSWSVAEQRNRSIDYFVVGGDPAAGISYTGAAPACTTG